jgi:hypothetical protein
VLLILGLLLPWLDLELTPGVSAWHLGVTIAWARLPGFLNFGIILVVPPIAGTLAVALAPHLARRALYWAGGSILIVAFYFAASTRLDDGGLLERILLDQQSFSSINALFGQGPVPSTLPLSVLGHGADTSSLALFGALGPGWFLSLGAGASLVLAGRETPLWTTHVSMHTGRIQIAVAAVSVIAILLGSSSLVAAGVGDHEMDEASTATVEGKPARAMDELAQAAKWNNCITATEQFDQVLGRVLAEQGRAAPLAKLSRAIGLPGGATQFLLYQGALAGHASQGVTDTVLKYLISEPRSVFLVSLASHFPDDPAVIFAVGVLDYKEGHYLETVDQMRRLLATTSAEWTESVAYTYWALSELRLGNLSLFRTYIVKAHALDRSLSNTFASELSAGLYLPGTL